MRTLLFLLCGVVCFAAPVPKKTVTKAAASMPDKPAIPNEGAIRTAVQSAIVAHVSKYQIGGQVLSASATVKEVRPMAGWPGKYSVTGMVIITVKSPNGNPKQTRTFSATVETEGGIKVSDVSV